MPRKVSERSKSRDSPVDEAGSDRRPWQPGTRRPSKENLPPPRSRRASAAGSVSSQDPASGEAEDKDRVHGEVGTSGELGSETPEPRAEHDGGYRKIEGVRMRRLEDSITGAAECHHGRRASQDSRRVPVEGDGEGVKHHGHSQNGKQYDSPQPVFARPRERNHENNPGEFERRQVNRLQIFSSARCRSRIPGRRNGEESGPRRTSRGELAWMGHACEAIERFLPGIRGQEWLAACREAWSQRSLVFD